MGDGDGVCQRGLQSLHTEDNRLGHGDSEVTGSCMGFPLDYIQRSMVDESPADLESGSFGAAAAKPSHRLMLEPRTVTPRSSRSALHPPPSCPPVLSAGSDASRAGPIRWILSVVVVVVVPQPPSLSLSLPPSPPPPLRCLFYENTEQRFVQRQKNTSSDRGAAQGGIGTEEDGDGEMRRDTGLALGVEGGGGDRRCLASYSPFLCRVYEPLSPPPPAASSSVSSILLPPRCVPCSSAPRATPPRCVKTLRSPPGSLLCVAAGSSPPSLSIRQKEAPEMSPPPPPVRSTASSGRRRDPHPTLRLPFIKYLYQPVSIIK
ncbi:unnamed protein product [Pleuronectes platessa]|uniref:Uncharacterized protein n=1 Tax=Pleuronectes platessa TaxID=8262 RepID=A0A9N7Y7S6_PLEPL|nr:unnamed protein product [Pleuronectes platessa]